MKIELISANADDDFLTVSVNGFQYTIAPPLAPGDMWCPEEALSDILDRENIRVNRIIGELLNKGVFDSADIDYDADFEPRREVFLQPFRGNHVGRVSVWTGREFVDYVLRSNSKSELRARCRKLLREKQTVKTHDFHSEEQPHYDIDYADGSHEFDFCGVDRKGRFSWW